MLSTSVDMRYPNVAYLTTSHFVVSWEHNPQRLDALGVLVFLNQFIVRVRASSTWMALLLVQPLW